MQTQNVEIRYRSIKYSTSQSSLSKQKTENNEPLWKSRLSVNKENRISENGLMHRTQTSKGIRITPFQNRCFGNRPTSSLYKLRIVANSSHIRTRASQAEQREEQEKKDQQNEKNFKLISPANDCPPYESYYQHLQETFLQFEPQLDQQRVQTQKIRLSLGSITKKVEGTLKQAQDYVHNELGKLRLQMSQTFKDHSRQIINTRESISSLKFSLSSLSEQLSETSSQLRSMQISYNA